jgi:hypothetical protein
MRYGVALALWSGAPALWAAGENSSELMALLETRLLGARRVVIEAELHSTGAVAAEFKGSTELGERNRGRGSYTGQLAQQAAALAFDSDGRTLQLSRGAETRAEAVGAESNRALLVGLLRMGLLHNVARLHGLEGPDHAGGGVEQWVVLEGFRPTTYALEGELEGAMSFGFDLVVGGEPAGSARLWLDPASGLPRRREQTVRFPQGEMKVVEDYKRFVLE